MCKESPYRLLFSNFCVCRDERDGPITRRVRTMFGEGHFVTDVLDAGWG
jgi:hypothetical protein